MQSVTSRLFCTCLRAVFHSPLVDNSDMSNKAGKKTGKVKSHYKPSKNFTFSRHKCNNCYYEILESKNQQTDKVILMLHGESFKVKLIDMYRRLAEKYSNLLKGVTVVSVDYRTFPRYEHASPVFTDFKNFPPTTLVCGGAEMDESDNDRVFEKMKSSGVNAELYKYDGMFHCFQLIPFLPESRDAYKKVFNRIRSVANELER